MEGLVVTTLALIPPTKDRPRWEALIFSNRPKQRQKKIIITNIIVDFFSDLDFATYCLIGIYSSRALEFISSGMLGCMRGEV